MSEVKSKDAATWMHMPPETAPGGCLWTKAGCAAVAAFKATRSRFAKPSHDLTPSTNTPEFRHLGPGYYNIGGDINRPSIEARAKGGKYIKGLFNPMQDATPRFGYTPYALVTENQKPGNEHIGPGAHHPADHETFQKRSMRNPKLKNAAFGASLASPRIQQKSKHELMMDKIWTRFDHVEAEKRNWHQKGGAFISKHEQRFSPPPCSSEDEKKAKKKRMKKLDEEFSERLQTISKTGKAGVRRASETHPVPEVPFESRTKGSILGGHQGVVWSTVQRFGKSPFEHRTELQHNGMAHVGPGTYDKASESTSIRARTAVSSNHSPAFVPGTPRFGRKRRVDVSDGGAARRAQKEERERREVEINALYGEELAENDQRPKTVR